MEKLILNQKNHLELEKRNFLIGISNFAENIPHDYKEIQINGRPRFNLRDIIKSLLIIAYNGMSYRRANYDLEFAYESGILEKIPKRSTLNQHMLSFEMYRYLEKLIQMSSIPFINHEDTLIIDSTFFPVKMYAGGYNNKPKEYTIRCGINTLGRSIKLHIGCLKNSRIIAYAKATCGDVSDNPFFKKIVSKIIDNGFNISCCLADAGYISKDNYALCQSFGIKNVFIDFRKNITGKRGKSFAWDNAFRIYKEQPDIWHETYRFRVLIEGIFSVIKRKWLNYIRSRKKNARYNELLLKILCYNMTIIGKNFNI